MKTKAASRELPIEDWNKLFLLVGGHIFFETVFAATQLDLFSLLSRRKNLTRAQIATSLKLKERPTRILLLGLAALGLLRKKGQRYSNSPMAEVALTRTSPRTVVPYFDFEHFIIYKPMHRFLEALRKNKNVGLQGLRGAEPTLYQRLARYPKLLRIFQEAMHTISVHANEDMRKSVDLSRYQHLVDVGGGDGTNAIALVKKYPKLQVTVFDIPSVGPIAKRNIARAGLSGRIRFQAGNCFTGPFPQAADCFLFAHFFTIWSEKTDQLLLKKTYQALQRGGSVIIFNSMQNDDETGPLTAAVGSPYFLTLATGEGMIYTWKEYETWLKGAGFRQIRRKVLSTEQGAIIGTKT